VLLFVLVHEQSSRLSRYSAQTPKLLTANSSDEKNGAMYQA
jgi:hypothetical protein